jgi:hypothetical protein
MQLKDVGQIDWAGQSDESRVFLSLPLLPGFFAIEELPGDMLNIGSTKPRLFKPRDLENGPLRECPPEANRGIVTV